MITAEQIDRWRSEPSEHERLEFKEAKNQFDFRTLCQYCVALANEGGGHLIMGIATKPPRKVVGTAAFASPSKAASELFHALNFRVQVIVVKHPGGRVVVFQIPSRPRGTAYHLKGAYLMRSGESLVPMTEDRLRSIFDEGKPEWLEQPSITGLDAQQVVELLDTQAFFDLLRLPYPTRRAGVIDRLRHEHIIDGDSGSGYAIRRIGAVILAKRLDAFSDLARKAPRIVVYTDVSKLDTRLDVTLPKGYATGFQNLIGEVMNLAPRHETIVRGIRTEQPLAPEVAVRELVANALIHQDFQIAGTSVMIEIYSNRIEISSPGEPAVPVERFIDGYESRNERLAGLMRRFGICEEKSSGIDRVVQAAEALQLPAPDFRTLHRRTTVVLHGARDFDSMNREDRLRACYQHCTLKWVKSERMTNQSLRERFHLPEGKSASVSQVIRLAIDNKLIKPDEQTGTSKKYARYLPYWA